MPVQINEVIVRAVVNPSRVSSGSSAPECPPATGSVTEAEVAERVLEIIREKNLR
jgi:hypothetical protein